MASGPPGLEAVARASRRHREGILNGYRHDKTNALAEGPDNAIKLSEKRGYGNPTFARMRRRCPFAPGRYKLSQNRVHLPQAGAGAKPRERRRGRGGGGGEVGAPARK